MDEFLQKLPKVELHAHLNGSMNIASIYELGAGLYGGNSPEFLQLCEQFIKIDVSNLDDCFEKFKFVHHLTATKQGLHLATMLVIRDFVKDHVVHLELRTTPKANAWMTRNESLLCVLKAIQEAQQKYNISVKLLPSIDRAQSVPDAAETLDLVLKLRAEYPDIIAGLDFSGNPVSGKFSNFKAVLEKAHQNGLKLAVHCAEIKNPSEIKEMVAFGMERCGHGTFLNDEQLESLGRRNIVVECCLTSNVRCGSVTSFADHHLKRILNANNPVVLCTDDSGIFDTTLTHEYEIAVQAFGLRCKDILALSMQSVEHAFVNEDKKAALRKKINQYFDENKKLLET